MITCRALTAKEANTLRARYLPGRRLDVRDFKLVSWLVIGGTILSIPFAIIFFGAARFLHGEEIGQSIQIGLLGLLPGFILGMIIAVLGIIGANRPALPGLKEDLAAGNCVVESYQAQRAWRLIDDGNADRPDLLLDLGRDHVLAIPTSEPDFTAEAREICVVSKLPSSQAIVSVEFTGQPIPLAETAVQTDNLWRNDDLPWYEPIALGAVPNDLRAAIENAG